MYVSIRSIALLGSLALSGLAVAQDSNSDSGSSNGNGNGNGGKKCAAQNIVDACLETTQPQLDACEANDWDCLCEQANNVLTCYNNCPGHPDQFGARQTKESYCNAAEAQSPKSSTTTTASSTTSTSEPTNTSDADDSDSDSGDDADAEGSSSDDTDFAVPLHGSLNDVVKLAGAMAGSVAMLGLL